MHFFFNPLVFLFVISTGWSQQKDSVVEFKIPTGYGDFVFRSSYSSTHSWSSFAVGHLTKLDEAIEKEAEFKKIFDDRVVVKLEVDSNGNLAKYSVHKPGKLDSFNAFITKVMDELMKIAREKEIPLGRYFGKDRVILMPFKFSWQ